MLVENLMLGRLIWAWENLTSLEVELTASGWGCEGTNWTFLTSSGLAGLTGEEAGEDFL